MPYDKDAHREKTLVALSSVGAAVGLTTLKIVVALLTGSLGILAEAAHSDLDLVAALMTFFAVRVADKPADATHNYGHYKIENLSAFFEALLLLITALWVIYGGWTTPTTARGAGERQYRRISSIGLSSHSYRATRILKSNNALSCLLSMRNLPYQVASFFLSRRGGTPAKNRDAYKTIVEGLDFDVTSNCILFASE